MARAVVHFFKSLYFGKEQMCSSYTRFNLTGCVHRTELFMFSSLQSRESPFSNSSIAQEPSAPASPLLQSERKHPQRELRPLHSAVTAGLERHLGSTPAHTTTTLTGCDYVLLLLKHKFFSKCWVCLCLDVDILNYSTNSSSMLLAGKI